MTYIEGILRPIHFTKKQADERRAYRTREVELNIYGEQLTPDRQRPEPASELPDDKGVL